MEPDWYVPTPIITKKGDVIRITITPQITDDLELLSIVAEALGKE